MELTILGENLVDSRSIFQSNHDEMTIKLDVF